MSSLVIQEATEWAAELRSALASRVVIADGAMGQMLQASDAAPEDFDGYERCNGALNATRPDIIKGAHRVSYAIHTDRACQRRS